MSGFLKHCHWKRLESDQDRDASLFTLSTARHGPRLGDLKSRTGEDSLQSAGTAAEEQESARHPDWIMCEEPVDEPHLIDDKKTECQTYQS
jgi:hypothetical protein